MRPVAEFVRKGGLGRILTNSATGLTALGTDSDSPQGDDGQLAEIADLGGYEDRAFVCSMVTRLKQGSFPGLNR